jgi:hypothetical protein
VLNNRVIFSVEMDVINVLLISASRTGKLLPMALPNTHARRGLEVCGAVLHYAAGELGKCKLITC